MELHLGEPELDDGGERLRGQALTPQLASQVVADVCPSVVMIPVGVPEEPNTRPDGLRVNAYGRPVWAA